MKQQEVITNKFVFILKDLSLCLIKLCLECLDGWMKQPERGHCKTMRKQFCLQK